MGVRSRCLLQRSRRHGCDRKRRALATGEHRGEGQTGVRYVNIGARLAPRCWHIHVDGSHALIALSQDPDTSCPLHSARALTQCVCPSSVNSSGGRHNQREPRAEKIFDCVLRFLLVLRFRKLALAINILNICQLPQIQK